MDDSSIIDLYLVRDQTALTCTVAKYGTRLRSLAENILDDYQSAQECENDTYWQAWRSIPPHEPRTYFFSFLAKITRHLALDCCRRRNRLKRSAQLESLTVEMEECIPSGHDTAQMVDGILLGETITRYLRKLPEEQRNVFLRRYWYLESIEDVAKRFGFSTSKVKSMLFRSRNGLRAYLEKEGYLE